MICEYTYVYISSYKNAMEDYLVLKNTHLIYTPLLQHVLVSEKYSLLGEVIKANNELCYSYILFK